MSKSLVLKLLTDIGPRFAEKEIVAARIIENCLAANNIKFKTQSFETEVPVCTKAELTVDGQLIDCIGGSLVSGEILSGDYLISHYGFSGDTPYNIAYSPITDEISVVDHYEVPSVSISRKDVIKIIMAKDVKGKIVIKRTKINTENILVGNLNNPQNLVFAHFDSIIGPGAVDNAGSAEVMMRCLINNVDLLKTTLFNFSGNEEMSYDNYNKYGYGFRIFEAEYSKLLEQAKQVIVMDGLGVGVPSFIQDKMDWVLMLKMIDKIKDKVFWLQNDQTPVLQHYHSFDDKIEFLQEKYLLAAEMLLKDKLVQ